MPSRPGVGPDGALFVTDSDMRAGEHGLMQRAGAGRVYRIGAAQGAGGQRDVRVALAHPRLANPNGIAWDATTSLFVIAPMGGDTVVTWRPEAAAPEPLAAGPGRYDGVVVTPEGRIFVASQATAGVHELCGDRLVKVISGVRSAADIGYDAKGRHLAVPMLGAAKVVVYAVPAR